MKVVKANKLTAMATAVSLALLLSSCATMPGARAPSPAVATARNTTAANTATANTVMAAAEEMPAVSQAQELGINREGRVLQLGRAAEQAPEFTPPPNNSVELNYEQEDLRLVLEQLGAALGLNMVIDPTIDAKVSLRTSPSNPLAYEDIWPLMRLLARNAGVSIEQAGAVWQIKRDPANIPAEIVAPDTLDDAQTSVVLQVTPLRYVSVDSVLPILIPMVGSEPNLTRLGSGNVIGIYGTPSQLQRVNALLAVMDDDPFQNRGIQLFELANSRAEDVAEELSEVLALIEGEQGAYQVQGLNRINAVLVVAPAGRGFTEISRWIKILDAASQEQVEQLFQYRVKNLTATTLATTLTSVFDQEEDNEEDNQRAVNQPGDVPFVTVGQGGVLAAIAENAAQQAADVTSANITVRIVADEETNSLLIRATPREYRQLLAILSNMDRVTPQVLIHAVIGQVTLTEGTRFGIDWTRVSGNLASGPAQLSSRLLPTTVVDNSGNAVIGSGLVLTRSFADGSAIIDATLNAIAEDNEVTLLARPTIIATNNKEGAIHVGQSVPVNNGTTTTGNGLQTENIAYQNVGVDLIITPQISDDGYVRLEIEQKLSSVEEGASANVGGNPTFTDQFITTSVVALDQETITLGGLIQEEGTDQQSGVPGLQKIPVVGRIFSYNELKNTRRELFVILRPQIIHNDERDDEGLRTIRESFTNVSALLEEAGL